MSPPRPGPDSPTLRHVAEAAGVSLKTASRALNDEAHVSPRTSQRVKEAASALGYRRNVLARDLRSHCTSNVVGMVIADAGNPFYSGIALAAAEVLAERGMLLFLGFSDEDAEREALLVEGFLERRVAGLLVISSPHSHPQRADAPEHGTPMVFLDRPAGDLAADEVMFDNVGGARAGIDHLLAQGHRRIGVVGDLGALPTHRERIAGVRRALVEAGAGIDESLFLTDAADPAGAEAAVRTLLALPDPPTAVFATNNRMMVGALRALAGVPSPPMLLGFDDLELAGALGVSVVSNSPRDMGGCGARMLLERVDGYAGPRRRVRLRTELRVHRSPAPPPR